MQKLSDRDATTGRRADSGSVMILTLMVMALVTVLATTVSVVTINNVQSSGRARQVGSALNAADAGLAQAISYLRSSGVRDLRCAAPGANTCAPNSWGSNTSPINVSVPGAAGQSYKVWIEAVAPYPLNDPGLYRVHSTGVAAGSASRSVTEDIGVTTSRVPLGIFARSFRGSGQTSVTGTSIFSTGCVYNREQINMSGTDVAYGIPAAVHTSQIITRNNGTNQYCSASSSTNPNQGDIHQDTPCSTDVRFRYDQDKLGGSLVGTDCAGVQSAHPGYYGPKDLDGVAGNEVEGSYIKDDTTLVTLFGLQSGGLTVAQIDQLRSTAQAQGNYWTSASGYLSPDEANAVMFFDLTATDPGGTVDLKHIDGFSREPGMSDGDAGCATKSLIIVIVGGNAKLTSNHKLAASLFLTSPDGKVTPAAGGVDFIGSIYADSVTLAGTIDLSMDTCFLANLSPALLDFGPSDYREVDR